MVLGDVRISSDTSTASTMPLMGGSGGTSELSSIASISTPSGNSTIAAGNLTASRGKYDTHDDTKSSHSLSSSPPLTINTDARPIGTFTRIVTLTAIFLTVGVLFSVLRPVFWPILRAIPSSTHLLLSLVVLSLVALICSCGVPLSMYILSTTMVMKRFRRAAASLAELSSLGVAVGTALCLNPYSMADGSLLLRSFWEAAVSTIVVTPFTVISVLLPCILSALLLVALLLSFRRESSFTVTVIHVARVRFLPRAFPALLLPLILTSFLASSLLLLPPLLISPAILQALSPDSLVHGSTATFLSPYANARGKRYHRFEEGQGLGHRSRADEVLPWASDSASSSVYDFPQETSVLHTVHTMQAPEAEAEAAGAAAVDEDRRRNELGGRDGVASAYGEVDVVEGESVLPAVSAPALESMQSEAVGVRLIGNGLVGGEERSGNDGRGRSHGAEERERDKERERGRERNREPESEMYEEKDSEREGEGDGKEEGMREGEGATVHSVQYSSGRRLLEIQHLGSEGIVSNGHSGFNVVGDAATSHSSSSGVGGGSSSSSRALEEAAVNFLNMADACGSVGFAAVQAALAGINDGGGTLTVSVRVNVTDDYSILNEGEPVWKDVTVSLNLNLINLKIKSEELQVTSNRSLAVYLSSLVSLNPAIWLYAALVLFAVIFFGTAATFMSATAVAFMYSCRPPEFELQPEFTCPRKTGSMGETSRVPMSTSMSSGPDSVTVNLQSACPVGGCTEISEILPPVVVSREDTRAESSAVDGKNGDRVSSEHDVSPHSDAAGGNRHGGGKSSGPPLCVPPSPLLSSEVAVADEARRVVKGASATSGVGTGGLSEGGGEAGSLRRKVEGQRACAYAWASLPSSLDTVIISALLRTALMCLVLLAIYHSALPGVETISHSEFDSYGDDGHSFVPNLTPGFLLSVCTVWTAIDFLILWLFVGSAAITGDSLPSLMSTCFKVARLSQRALLLCATIGFISSLVCLLPPLLTVVTISLCNTRVFTPTVVVGSFISAILMQHILVGFYTGTYLSMSGDGKLHK